MSPSTSTIMRRHPFLLFGALLPIAAMLWIATSFTACQDPTEPTLELNAVLRVHVVDDIGTPMENITIRHAAGGGVTDAQLTSMATTDSTGVAVIPLAVPAEGRVHTLLAVRPNDEYLDVRVEHLVPCSASELTLVMVYNAATRCGGQSMEPSRTISICLPTVTSAEVMSRSYRNSCPCDLTPEVTFMPALAGLTHELVVTDSNGVRMPGGTIPARARYHLIVRYTTTTPLAATAVLARLRARCDTNSMSIDMPLSIGAGPCETCKCPELPKGRYRVTNDAGNFCAGGAPIQRSVKLDAVFNNRNGSSGCRWELTLLPNESFTSGAFVYGTIGSTPYNLPITVDPGQQLGPLTCTFDPSQMGPGVYTDSLIYSITTKDPYGSAMPCNDKLAIVLSGRHGVATCTIVPDSPPYQAGHLLGPAAGPWNLVQCVGLRKVWYRFLMKNDGDCPSQVQLQIGNPKLFLIRQESGPARTIDNTTVIDIPAKGKVSFAMIFTPDGHTVYPNGRTNPGIFVFNDLLRISGCINASIPLVGKAYEDRLPNSTSPCLSPSEGNLKECTWKTGSSMILQEDGTLEYSEDPDAVKRSYVHIDSAGISTGPRTVTFTSSYLTFRILTNKKFGSTALLIQDIQDDPMYLLACGQPGGTSTVTAREEDVVIFSTSSGDCGVLYFKQLIINPGEPTAARCFFAYPF